MRQDDNSVALREVLDDDLAVFLSQQSEPEGIRMAAFTRQDHTDPDAFIAHWRKCLANETITIRTVLYNGNVAGSVASYVAPDLGRPEVTYWIGREFWGQGIASQALRLFLDIQTIRPLMGRAAQDNLASLRVLKKCGFKRIGQETAFAHARGEDTVEVIFELLE